MKETIEHVRTRKNDAAAFVRKRTEAAQTLRDIESKPQRDASGLYKLRFELAQRWIDLHVSSPYDAEITQVGNDGFYWKRLNGHLPIFIAWDESARMRLEAAS